MKHLYRFVTLSKKIVMVVNPIYFVKKYVYVSKMLPKNLII